MRNLITLLISALFVAGCASSYNNIELMKKAGFSNYSLEGKRIAYYDADRITAKMYKESLDKIFPDRAKIDSLAYAGFIKGLDEANFGAFIVKQKGKAPIMPAEETSLKNIDAKKVDETIAKLDFNFALIVRDIEVGNFSNAPEARVMPKGYTPAGVDLKKKGCIIKINYDLWDLKTKKTAAKFSSFGAAEITQDLDEDTFTKLLMKVSKSAANYLAADTLSRSIKAPAGHIIEKIAATASDLDKLRKNRTAVTMPASFSLDEFKVTFKDEYKDSTAFFKKLMGLFKEKITENIPDIKLKIIDLNVPNELINTDYADQNSISKASSFLSGIDYEYLIAVKNVTIGNKTQAYSWGPTVTALPGGGKIISGGGGGKIESCVVSIDFDCWDVKEQKKILSARINGVDQVAFFNFTETLNKAMKKAASSFAGYLAGFE